MKKLMLVIMVVLLSFVTLVKADVNVTTNIDSDGGDVNFWANPNSGEGKTNYYLDGLNFDDYTKSAANSRGSIVNKIRRTFMDWSLQSNGKFGWQEVAFEDLERDYQRLRYVLETWFVPRKEMQQVIQNQQMQITQLQLEIKSIQIVLDEEALCNARKQIMAEMDLPFIKCGNVTWYANGLGLEQKQISGVK